MRYNSPDSAKAKDNARCQAWSLYVTGDVTQSSNRKLAWVLRRGILTQQKCANTQRRRTPHCVMWRCPRQEIALTGKRRYTSNLAIALREHEYRNAINVHRVLKIDDKHTLVRGVQRNNGSLSRPHVFQAARSSPTERPKTVCIRPPSE